MKEALLKKPVSLKSIGLVVVALSVFVIIFARNDVTIDVEPEGLSLPPTHPQAVFSEMRRDNNMYRAIAERPLFNRSRKQSLNVGGLESEAEDGFVQSTNRYVLLGTIIIGGESRALIKRVADSKVEILGVGNNIDGAALIDIKTNRVVLRLNGDNMILHFIDNTK